VIRLGRLRRFHRRHDGEALAVRRQIKIRRCPELRHPHQRPLRREHIALHSVLYGHHLVTGLVEQLAATSRPIGDSPPLLEICHLPPCPDACSGNARTYTSSFPDSFD